MSNPTTPFGWQMPTNTDLVTDLPADFEVFGQAVATSMQDLLGGTTGQVLKKNTNADMDFVWSADAAGMTNPMTTTGDIIYSSPGSTPVRLGIGTANQQLRVNSGANAPEWFTPAASGGMTLLSTTTLSGASTTISSINQTYTDLVIRIFGVTNATADGYFKMDPNNSSLAWAFGKSSRTTVNTASGLGPIFLLQSDNFEVMTRTDSTNVINVTINNYADTTNSKSFITYGYFVNPTAPLSWAGLSAGVIRTNSAISSLVFTNTGGNFSTGTVLIYGVS